nr:hypothetical protein 2 [ssRNA positive-strand virus sp.]
MVRVETATVRATRPTAKGRRSRTAVAKNIVVTTTKRGVRAAPRRRVVDPLNSAVEALITTFSSPNMLLFTAITLFIAIDYQNNPADNIIIQLAKQIGRNTTVGKFLIDNGQKFIGMLMLLPAAYSAPRSQRIASVAAVMIAAYLMPTVSYITYFVLSMSMRIFHSTRNRELRFFFIIIAGFLIFLTATSMRSNGSLSFPNEKHDEVTTTESNEL